MSKSFPRVPLARCVRYRKEFVQISDLENYKRCRVQLHAKGIVLRDIVAGSEIKTKEQQVCRAGEFLVAEIDAKVGGFGIVPADLDGAIVSSHYFLFQVDGMTVDPRFLEFFVRTPAFREQVSAQGSTNYAAIRPKDVLGYEVPLPPLFEQRRIVGRVEELAEKIAEVRGLRQQTVEEAEAVFASAVEMAFRPRSGWIEARVGDFCEPPQYGYTASATTEEVGPRFLRITDIQDGRVNWDSVPFCRCLTPDQYLLRDDDIVFARTGATTGKSFMIRECPRAVFASYLIRLRVIRLVTAEYLYGYFQTPSYWSQISDERKGTGQANVNGKRLANIRVPIAPREEQDEIIAYVDKLAGKLDVLKGAHAETAAELAALLPSILDKAFRGEL